MTDRHSPTDIHLEAARWHARWLNSEDSRRESELAQWRQWLQKDLANLEAAYRIEDIYERSGESRFARDLDIDEWLAQGRAPVSGIAPADIIIRNSGKRRSRMFVAAACVGLVSVAAVMVWRLTADARVYTTGVGEQQSFRLDDGSLLQLNTQSRARVVIGKSSRDIELSGEALFTVARDPDRPFFVHTRSATVQAIGTRFNVYESESNTTIAVLEGVVQVLTTPEVQPLAAVAGESVSVQPGKMSKATDQHITNSVSWQTRRLVFEETRLADVAREFNRYNHRQFRISPDMEDLRLTGTFDPGYPDSLVAWLLDRDDTHVRAAGKAWVVERR